MRSHPTRARPLLPFLLIVLCAGNAAFAGDSDQIRYHSKGRAAGASFHFPDASGCISTWIYVTAEESVTWEPGTDRSSGAYLGITLLIIDRCDGWRALFRGNSSPTLEPGMLTLQGNLERATAVADVVLQDPLSGITHTVAIDLAWKGTGEHWTGSEREIYQQPGYRYDARSNGTIREAETTGTVLLDGAPLPAGTEISAGLHNSRLRYVEISRLD
jgi:hypothetical protein